MDMLVALVLVLLAGIIVTLKLPAPDRSAEDDKTNLAGSAPPRRINRAVRRAFFLEARRNARRARRRTRRAKRAGRRALADLYTASNPGTAKAMRITGGVLPEASHGLCRLTKWGKNHHLDTTKQRTLCGQVAKSQRDVDWRRGWCVQCKDVSLAMGR